jgi:hypothetical protein
LFDPPTFFHLLTWLSLNSFNQLSSAHFDCSLNFIHSANFFSSAPSVESEFNQPTFSSACSFS